MTVWMLVVLFGATRVDLGPFSLFTTCKRVALQTLMMPGVTQVSCTTERTT